MVKAFEMAGYTEEEVKTKLTLLVALKMDCD